MKSELGRLSRMKECLPRQEDTVIKEFFNEISEAFKRKIQEIEDKI